MDKNLVPEQFNCISVTLEKCKKKMQYGFDYSGTRVLSSEN